MTKLYKRASLHYIAFSENHDCNHWTCAANAVKNGPHQRPRDEPRLDRDILGSPKEFWAQVGNPKRKAIRIRACMAAEEDPFAHKLLIPRRLLILSDGRMGLTNRYSNSAIWQRARSRLRPSPHKAFYSSGPRSSATSSPETRLSLRAMTSSKTDETGEIRFVENGERARNLRCVEQPTLRTQRGYGGPMVRA